MYSAFYSQLQKSAKIYSLEIDDGMPKSSKE